MKIKEAFRPNAFKAITFIFICFLYLYLAKQSACAVGFGFVLCYNLYGTPFPYLITGDLDIASAELRELFLGSYFSQYETFYFNPATLALNLITVYLISCFVYYLIGGTKLSDSFKKHK